LHGAEPTAGITPSVGAKADVRKYPKPNAFATIPTIAVHLLKWMLCSMTKEIISPARYRNMKLQNTPVPKVVGSF
jgi:hypothetical protein